MWLRKDCIQAVANQPIRSEHAKYMHMLFRKTPSTQRRRPRRMIWLKVGTYPKSGGFSMLILCWGSRATEATLVLRGTMSNQPLRHNLTFIHHSKCWRLNLIFEPSMNMCQNSRYTAVRVRNPERNSHIFQFTKRRHSACKAQIIPYTACSQDVSFLLSQTPLVSIRFECDMEHRRPHKKTKSRLLYGIKLSGALLFNCYPLRWISKSNDGNSKLAWLLAHPKRWHIHANKSSCFGCAVSSFGKHRQGVYAGWNSVSISWTLIHSFPWTGFQLEVELDHCNGRTAVQSQLQGRIDGTW